MLDFISMLQTNYNNILRITLFNFFKTGDPFYDAIISTIVCLLYTSPSPRDRTRSRMPSSA